MTRIHDLEERLRAAKARVDRADTSAEGLSDADVKEYWEAIDALSQIERELAAAKGEEHAVPLDFPIRWDVGAPLPFLIASDDKTFLTFYIDEPDPDWDGTYVTIKDPGDGSVESLALVEFEGSVSVKFGSPNDEVFHGHPLYGRGQEPYTAQIVRNSRWISELEHINSVHDYYYPEGWKSLNHYVFWFHATTLECVAGSYTVETFRETMPDLLARVSERLL